MKKAIILWGLVGIALLTGQAQENTIKIGLLSPLGRNLTLEYERVIADQQSIAVHAGYVIPWNDPFSLADDFEGISNPRVSGFNVTPQYRFYLSQRSYAPKGLYVAPYLRYYRLSFETDYQDDFDMASVGGSLRARYSTTGLGAQLGYQWIVNDLFTVDWYFLGLGLYLYGVGVEAHIEQARGVGLEEIRARIDEQLSELPLVGNGLDAEIEGQSIRGSIALPFLGFRTGLSLGYRF
jgi:hypothetical protein